MKLTLFMIMGSLLFLASCGRVSAPIQEKGSFYPHTYQVSHSTQEEE